MDLDPSNFILERQLPEDDENFSRRVLSSSSSEAQCLVCTRTFPLDNEMTDNLEALAICRDCKLLVLGDSERVVSSRNLRRRRHRRRTRYASFDSSEDSFSQQFSHLINSARRGHEADVDSPDSVQGHLSRSSTPNQSQRWRQISVTSDNESDSLDYADSVLGEMESYIGLGGYGGDSDASTVVLGREGIASSDDHLYPDTDIDPMHAWLDRWNSENQEGEETEWEEADIDESATVIIEQHQHFNSNAYTGSVAEIESLYSTSDIDEPSSVFIERHQYSYNSNAGADGSHEGEFQNGASDIDETATVIIERHLDFDSEDPINVGDHTWNNWRMAVGNGTHVPDIFAGLEGIEVRPTFLGNPDDYVNARQFEELLEQLAENDNSRRGAPPAAASFVDSLPSVIIASDDDKNDDLICAVCKDPLTSNAEATQLPCMHFYHFPCITPWLSTRNTCPVCRYELPTDDPEYESKRRAVHVETESTSQPQQHEIRGEIPLHMSGVTHGNEVEIMHENTSEESSLDNSTREPLESSEEPHGRSGWFFLATAPLVTLVGLVLVFCFRGPPAERSDRCDHQTRNEVAPVDTKRRWWSLF